MNVVVSHWPASVAARNLLAGQWTVPVLVTVAFSVVWWGWHLPVAYDAARSGCSAKVWPTTGSGRLLRPPKPAWPSRPGLMTSLAARPGLGQAVS